MLDPKNPAVFNDSHPAYQAMLELVTKMCALDVGTLYDHLTQTHVETGVQNPKRGGYVLLLVAITFAEPLMWWTIVKDENEVSAETAPKPYGGSDEVRDALNAIRSRWGLPPITA